MNQLNDTDGHNKTSFIQHFICRKKCCIPQLKRWGHGLVKGDVPLLILETLKAECHLIDKFKFDLWVFSRAETIKRPHHL